MFSLICVGVCVWGGGGGAATIWRFPGGGLLQYGDSLQNSNQTCLSRNLPYPRLICQWPNRFETLHGERHYLNDSSPEQM